jgi:hypothetical protein
MTTTNVGELVYGARIMFANEQSDGFVDVAYE